MHEERTRKLNVERNLKGTTLFESCKVYRGTFTLGWLQLALQAK